MPVDKQKVLRFQVLNECFRNIHRDYTIDDLVEICNKVTEQKLDKSGISKRTIQNDINELQLPPYNIELDESLRIGRKRIYRYLDPNFSIKLVQLSDVERDRIEDAIDVLEQYSDNPQFSWVKFCLENIVSDTFTDRCNSLISFQNNPDLYGIKHFEQLLKSIANKQPLKITYQKYPRKENNVIIESKQYQIDLFPYLLKQYNDRWFLIGREHNTTRLSVYALDRIITIKNLHIRYEESEVDFGDYYDNVIGVSVRNDIENVVIRVNRERYPYIETKPLHWTQTELKEQRTEEFVTIRIKVVINNELISQIMSFGDDMEVLAPQELRKVIENKILNMINHYEECK